jgi:hypothetical protein
MVFEHRVFRYVLIAILVFLANCAVTKVVVDSQGQPSIPDEHIPAPNAACSSHAKRGQWQAGTFRGLVMGEAKVVDLLRAIGEPRERSDLSGVGDKNHVLYFYDGSREIPGKIVIMVDKKSQTVINVEIRPENYRQSDIIRIFGDNCVLTRYTLREDCPGDTFDGGMPIEDPDGNIEVLEYRDRGIAVFLEDETVESVSYQSEPLAADPKKCKPQSK